MSESKNIYQRINAIMKDCEYLQKKEADKGKGIKYDDVIAMLRKPLMDHGVVMVINQDSFEQVGGIEGKNQKVYQGSYQLKLVNIDNPEDFVTHTVFAQGMDGGDKAPGKSQTYAVKIMVTKAFCLETGEDEESRWQKLESAEAKHQSYIDQWVSAISDCETTNDLQNVWRDSFKALSKDKNALKQITEAKDKKKADLIVKERNNGAA